MFYTEFIKVIYETPSQLSKWQETNRIEADSVLLSFTKAKKSLTEPKILSLQFKIIHNITNCGANLAKWGIKENKLCNYCRTPEIDTVTHALVECPTTDMWLNSTLQYIDPLKTIFVNTTLQDFIFGVDNTAINAIFLIMKKYVCYVRGYKKHFSNKSLVQQILRRIAVDYKLLSPIKFSKKWLSFPDLVVQSECMCVGRP